MKIYPPRGDMMFRFDYAFSIVDYILHDKNLISNYKIVAFNINTGKRITDIIYIRGENIILYLQYEYINNEIFSIVNPPSEELTKWIEMTYLRLLNSDNVVKIKNIDDISGIYYKMINGYETAIESGNLHWAYISALTV